MRVAIHSRIKQRKAEVNATRNARILRETGCMKKSSFSKEDGILRGFYADKEAPKNGASLSA